MTPTEPKDVQVASSTLVSDANTAVELRGWITCAFSPIISAWPLITLIMLYIIREAISPRRRRIFRLARLRSTRTWSLVSVFVSRRCFGRPTGYPMQSSIHDFHLTKFHCRQSRPRGCNTRIESYQVQSQAPGAIQAARHTNCVLFKVVGKNTQWLQWRWWHQPASSGRKSELNRGSKCVEEHKINSLPECSQLWRMQR